LHKLGWIGDNGNVIFECWLLFFGFCAVSVHVAFELYCCA
jgi:hypothetical protein